MGKVRAPTFAANLTLAVLRRTEYYLNSDESDHNRHAYDTHQEHGKVEYRVKPLHATLQDSRLPSVDFDLPNFQDKPDVWQKPW